MSGYSQARKRSTNPNFWVQTSSSGVGVLRVKGRGPKSSVCPSKPREDRLLVGHPGILPGYPPKSRKTVWILEAQGCFAGFARISWSCPKSLRKESLCSILSSEVSKKGLAGVNKPPRTAKKALQKCVPLLLRGQVHRKDFFAPTPCVRQPLFETSILGPHIQVPKKHINIKK